MAREGAHQRLDGGKDGMGCDEAMVMGCSMKAWCRAIGRAPWWRHGRGLRASQPWQPWLGKESEAKRGRAMAVTVGSLGLLGFL